MALDASVPLRKLPPSHISQLSIILEFSEQWKKLMAVIPNELRKDNFDCCISGENPAKYNINHLRLLEDAARTYKRPRTQILLDEWGSSGRIRPAVGHLLHLLLAAELYRAADYVSEEILGGTSIKRPSLGPAAEVPVTINSNITNFSEFDRSEWRERSALIPNFSELNQSESGIH